MMLSKSGECGCPCLVADLRGNASISVFSEIPTVGLSCMTLCLGTFLPCLLRTFY